MEYIGIVVVLIYPINIIILNINLRMENHVLFCPVSYLCQHFFTTTHQVLSWHVTCLWNRNKKIFYQLEMGM